MSLPQFDAELLRDTTEYHRGNIRKRAAQHFSEHVITKEATGRWFCGKPGTGIYSFRVLCVPGAVIVYGDIGELILRPYASPPDELAWLRGAAKNAKYPEYCLGKCPPAHKQEEFLSGDAVKYLRNMVDEAHSWYDTCQERPDEILPLSLVGPEYVAEVARTAKEIAERWESNRGYMRPALAWSDAVYSVTCDPEMDHCLDFSAEMLFCFNALCWFVEHLPETEKSPE